MGFGGNIIRHELRRLCWSAPTVIHGGGRVFRKVARRNSEPQFGRRDTRKLPRDRRPADGRFQNTCLHDVASHTGRLR